MMCLTLVVDIVALIEARIGVFLEVSGATELQTSPYTPSRACDVGARSYRDSPMEAQSGKTRVTRLKNYTASSP